MARVKVLNGRRWAIGLVLDVAHSVPWYLFVRRGELDLSLSAPDAGKGSAWVVADYGEAIDEAEAKRAAVEAARDIYRRLPNPGAFRQRQGRA